MEKHPSLQRLGIFTGIFLILGFALPVYLTTGDSLEFSFPNIESLGMSIVPFWAKISLLWPAIGGILCLVAVAQSNFLARGTLYGIAGFMSTIITVFLTRDMLSDSSAMGGLNIGSGFLSGLPFVVIIMFQVGLLATLIGAYSGQTSPKNRIAPYLALAGGILMLLSMLIPIELPRQRTAIPMLLPFNAMSEGNGEVGLVLLLFIILAVLTCIFAISWGIRYKSGVNFAKSIKVVLGIALGLCISLVTLGMLIEFDSDDFFSGILAAGLIIIKGVGLTLAPLMAKVASLSEFVVVKGAPVVDHPFDDDQFKPNPPAEQIPTI